jgi:hypothetical protein
VLMDVWFEECVHGRTGRYSRDGLRLAWEIAFQEQQATAAYRQGVPSRPYAFARCAGR